MEYMIIRMIKNVIHPQPGVKAKLEVILLLFLKIIRVSYLYRILVKG